VIPAEGARAEVAKGRGRGAAHAAVVPRTLPTPCGQIERRKEENIFVTTQILISASFCDTLAFLYLFLI